MPGALVGGLVQHARMVTVVDGLAQLDERRAASSDVRTTGLSGLDSATGGFTEGQVWIVVGTPGQGRTTLAAQWAWLLSSQHGFTTQLVSRTDPAVRGAARVVSAVAKVPLNHLWSDGLRGHDNEKIRRVMPKLASAPLEILGPRDLSIVDTDMAELPAPGALVVDDAHRAGGMFPQRVASIAASGTLVVLTMPRHRVVSGAGLDPSWAEVADFILDIDCPDLLDRNSIRPGEAEVHLLRNRWGPTRSDAVVFQGHYSRFVDLG